MYFNYCICNVMNENPVGYTEQKRSRGEEIVWASFVFPESRRSNSVYRSRVNVSDKIPPDFIYPQWLGCFSFSSQPQERLSVAMWSHKVSKVLFGRIILCTFFWPHPCHVEALRPGAELAPQLQPVPQLWQCQIFNPLCHTGTFNVYFLIGLKGQ